MSRQANFFSQSFTQAGPSTKPIALSSLLPQKATSNKPSLSDLDERLNQAVAALLKKGKEDDSQDDSIWCNSSSSSSDYSDDEEDEMEELEDYEEEEEEEDSEFEFDSISEISTPASSIMSMDSSTSLPPLCKQPLKPALKPTLSTTSAPPGLASFRKCSFSEEPPRICRTYSSTEYLRAGPILKKLNTKSYFDIMESKEKAMHNNNTTSSAQADELALCRFPSNTKQGR